MLSPLATYYRADQWRKAQPAPTQVVEPTTPVSYVRLTWLVAAVVFWILLGCLVAKYAPAQPPAPAPAAAGGTPATHLL